MGKKNKERRKELASQKQEKAKSKRNRKAQRAEEAEDVDKLIAQFKAKDAERTAVVETELEAPPKPRSNASFVSHPSGNKNELILFGGELYDNNKCTVFNDLLIFSLKTRKWKSISSPNTPLPRSAHQAVTTNTGGGQMWIFGGEFSSPNEVNFHHYRDLWCLHLSTMKWEEVKINEGPTGRSGHRMVVHKNILYVFGGYVDNGQVIKYNNDLYSLDLGSSTKKWVKYDFGFNVCPSPRSAVGLVAIQDRIVLYGGYFIGLEDGKQLPGQALDDLWEFNPATSSWAKLKRTFETPDLRSGFSMTAGQKNRAILFGGVVDLEEEEDDLISSFCNDMHIYIGERQKWAPLKLREKKTKRRRRAKGGNQQASDKKDSDETEDQGERKEEGEGEGEGEGEEVPEGGQGKGQGQGEEGQEQDGDGEPFAPCPRSSAMMTVKGNTLYLFGGIIEKGQQEITLSDMYALNLNKLDKWETIQDNEEGWEAPLPSEDNEDEGGEDDGKKEEEEEEKKEGETEKKEEEEEKKEEGESES